MERNLAIILVGLNLLTFIIYGIDKCCARFHLRRISERTLITLTLLGGGVGTLLSMILFRHKIRKAKFWFFAILAILMESLIIFLRHRAIFF